MKASDITRQDITERYSEEAIQELLESVESPGSEPMTGDELLESLGIADED